MWLRFARENQRAASSVHSEYVTAITDAVEGCFSFRIDEDQYCLEPYMKGRDCIGGAIQDAIQIELVLQRLYEEASAQSQAFMPGLARCLTKIGAKRRCRINVLQERLAHE